MTEAAGSRGVPAPGPRDLAGDLGVHRVEGLDGPVVGLAGEGFAASLVQGPAGGPGLRDRGGERPAVARRWPAPSGRLA